MNTAEMNMADFRKKLRLAYEANQNLEEEIKQYKGRLEELTSITVNCKEKMEIMMKKARQDAERITQAKNAWRIEKGKRANVEAQLKNLQKEMADLKGVMAHEAEELSLTRKKLGHLVSERDGGKIEAREIKKQLYKVQKVKNVTFFKLKENNYLEIFSCLFFFCLFLCVPKYHLAISSREYVNLFSLLFYQLKISPSALMCKKNFKGWFYLCKIKTKTDFIIPKTFKS